MNGPKFWLFYAFMALLAGSICATAANPPTPVVQFQVLHSFGGSDGTLPFSLIEMKDGSLCGTVTDGDDAERNGSTLFKLAQSGALTTLHFFTRYNEGEVGPQPSIILANDGNCYGCTSGDGAYGDGTIFRVTPPGKFTLLHTFRDRDGAQPMDLLEGGDGNFYGVTADGGSRGGGTIFKLTKSGAFSTLYSFAAPKENGSLTTLLRGMGGSLYEAFLKDRKIYEITPSGVLKTLRLSGRMPDGDGPEIVFAGRDGSLYGTTVAGEPSWGTIFKISPTGKLTVLHSFHEKDGQGPVSDLIGAIDGDFYGTTEYGGVYDWGVVFKISPTGNYTVLHSFDVKDGGSPTKLIHGRDGNFYGVTISGGDYPAPQGYGEGCGTVFKMTPSGELTTLHSFSGSDGFDPEILFQGRDGSLYGATNWGGAYSSKNGGQGYGTIFKITAASAAPEASKVVIVTVPRFAPSRNTNSAWTPSSILKQVQVFAPSGPPGSLAARRVGFVTLGKTSMTALQRRFGLGLVETGFHPHGARVWPIAGGGYLKADCQYSGTVNSILWSSSPSSLKHFGRARLTFPRLPLGASEQQVKKVLGDNYKVVTAYERPCLEWRWPAGDGKSTLVDTAFEHGKLSLLYVVLVD